MPRSVDGASLEQVRRSSMLAYSPLTCYVALAEKGGLERPSNRRAYSSPCSGAWCAALLSSTHLKPAAAVASPRMPPQA